MKKIKSKIFIFLSFLCAIFSIGTAFSSFFFLQGKKLDVHVDRSKGVMDDIDINYELDANAYTVYFFSSSKWANYIQNTTKSAKQSLEDYLSINSYKNYLNKTEASALKEFGYFPDDDESELGTYGYKVRYEDTCISTDTFDQMPVPLTTAKDRYGYLVRFSGWTANFANAIKYGYNSQGTYDYISSYDELSIEYKTSKAVYDKLGLTKTIFVFPVLTAGKEYDDYDKNKDNSDFKGQTVVRIHNRDARKLYNDNGSYKDMYFGRELYFSQTGEDNSAYYFYNNLKVKEKEMLYLDVDINSSGTWYNFKNDGTQFSWPYVDETENTQITKTNEKWDGENYDPEGTTSYRLNPLFDTTDRFKLGDCAVNQPGVYNIYAYICKKGEEDKAPDAFKDKKLTNSSLVWYEDTRDKSNSTTVGKTYSWGLKPYIYNIYVKIEKIMEFGLSGGRTKSLQYVDALQMNSSSQIKPADTETATNTSSRYYILNNVFLEGQDINETITSNNKNDGSFYKYPSDVSVILSNDGDPINVSKISDQELTSFNIGYQKIYGDKYYDFTASEKKQYQIINSNTIKAEVSNPPFPSGSYTDDDMIFINPKESGFYSIVAKMTMTREAITDASQTVDSKHPYRLKFEKCQVAICLGRKIGASVFLYDRRTDDNLQIQKLDSKFIDTNGNWYANADIPYGTVLKYDTEFKLKDGSIKKLSEILGVGTTTPSHLTNHLTGREFKFNDKGESIQLRRNYAFYIMPGAWQEGELN